MNVPTADDAPQPNPRLGTKGIAFSLGKSRALFAAILASALIMTAIFATAIYWLFDVARSEIEESAFLVSTHVASLIDRHDHLSSTLARGWEKDGDAFPFRLFSQIVNDQVFLAPQIAVSDHKGVVVASSRPGGVGVDLADREHFRVHAEDRVKGLYISDPVIGRTTNRPSVQFTHRIDRDGVFAGMVSLSFNPSAFFTTQTPLRGNGHGNNAAPYDQPILAAISPRGTHLAISTTENLPDRFDDWVAKAVSGARGAPSKAASFFFLDKSSIWLAAARVIPQRDIIILAAAPADHYAPVVAAILSASLLALTSFVVLLRLVSRSAQDRSAAAFGKFLRNLLIEVPTQISLFDSAGACRFRSRDAPSGLNIEYARGASKSPEPKVVGMGDADRLEFLKWYRTRRTDDATQFNNSFLYWNRGPENQESTIALEWFRINISGEALECWMATDVTKLMQAQLLAQHSSRLAQIGEMAAGLAHEINQPLNVIALASQNLVDTVRAGCGACMKSDVRDKAIEKGTRIANQVARAAKIVNNLRIFARRDKLEVEPIDVGQQLTAAIDLLAHRFRLEIIAVDMSGPSEKTMVVANRGALQQVFINLLGNACDSVIASRRPGERRIRCSVRHGESPGVAFISIEDNGAGFPEIVLARLFEPFVTTKPMGEGTGLGLSIAHSIVSEIGGSIRVANAKPDQTAGAEPASQPVGAVVTVVLPAREVGGT